MIHEWGSEKRRPSLADCSTTDPIVVRTPAVEVLLNTRNIQELIEKALALATGLSEELRGVVMNIDDPLRLAYLLGSLLDMPADELTAQPSTPPQDHDHDGTARRLISGTAVKYLLLVINIVTGFRGFRPSMLGKINTTVQIIAIAAIIFAASVPYGTGYYLPTIYTTVFTFSVLSGAHYVFFVSKLVNEDRRSEADTLK